MSNPFMDELKQELTRLAEAAPSARDLMGRIASLLKQKMSTYDWVGFYMIEPGSDPPALLLGEFQGAPSPHTRIPLNQGICGAAVTSGETVVVDDVAADSRYLACSIETKSEIVAPIFIHGKVVGEIDIDSHTSAAFSPQDRLMVEHCAQLVGSKLESEITLRGAAD